MAAPSNTAVSFNLKGNREDLEDAIYLVEQEETPFITNIGTTKAKAVKHDWQTQALRAPSATGSLAVEGNDAVLSAADVTVRLENFCQINQDARGVSGTQEVVDKAGRKSELAYQKAKLGSELKRDVEKRFIGNYASNDEAGTTPRASAGALAWLTSNVSRGASGASGGFSAGIVAAASPGTQRTFTEALLKTVLASCFNNGGKPNQIYLGATQKQTFSGFTGIAQIRHDAPGTKMASIIGAADIYVGDFGKLAAIPHPYGLTRDALIVDPEMFAVGTLRGWGSTNLAKTGDSEKFQILAEKTLVCKNERAHGVVADLL